MTDELEAFRRALSMWRMQLKGRYVYTIAGLVELRTRHMREEWLLEQEMQT